MITAFIRVEGKPFGLIATIKASRRARSTRRPRQGGAFLQLCDAFRHSDRVTVAIRGLHGRPRGGKTAIVRHVARMFGDGRQPTVPLFGGGAAQGLRPRRAIDDRRRLPRLVVYGGWPTGEFGGMGSKAMSGSASRKEMEAIADPDERENYY